MGSRRIESVAIAGDGPAGTALATLLARAGLRVALYSRGRSDSLLVGESLVPTVIPILRELGVEEEVRGYSAFKPGATFVMDDDVSVEISFERACVKAPPYAYNVPRNLFDATLLAACEKSGARIVRGAARLERSAGDESGPGVHLSEESLGAAGSVFDAHPDLVVDASGRARIVARLLDLPERGQDRRDMALFAHWSGVPIDREGHVHSDRLGRGWCWRIPLPGRVSLGIVVDPAILRALGDTAEDQYDAFLRSEPHLTRLTAEGQRLTPVVKFNNYQLTSLRGVGPGWALVGDAFGFIDPVFSSGVFLALDGARNLARAILAGTPAALRRYERRQARHIEAWRSAITTFYDGRFVALFRSGEEAAQSGIGRVLAPHISKHVARVFTGEGTTSGYSRWLLGFASRHALGDYDPDQYRIN